MPTDPRTTAAPAWRTAAATLHRWLGGTRVPYRQQLSASECGAACLAMVLSHHGRDTTVAECRDVCEPGRDGLTARTIAAAARAFGLRVQAYVLEPEAFRYASLPAIVHWNFNHFVVVEAWSPGGVRIVDPGGGRRMVGMKEFGRSFTGVTLILEPGEAFERRRGRAGTGTAFDYLRRMFAARDARSVVGQLLVASLILQVLGLAMPLATKVIIDSVLPMQMTDMMGILGVGLLLLVASQALVGYLRQLLVIYLRARLDTRLMMSFFEHLLSLPFAFFQRRSSGDLLLRLGSNSLIRETLTNQTVTVVLDGFLVTVYLVIILSQSLAFGALVAVLGVVQVSIMLATRHRVHDLMQRDLATRSEEQSYLVEALKGIAILKAQGTEDRAFDRWSDLYHKQLGVSLERSYFSAHFDTAMNSLRVLAPLLLLWYGSIRVLDGTMTLGTMLALNALAAAFLAPLAGLVMSGQQLQTVRAHLERIADVMQAQPEETPAVPVPPRRLRGRIELRDLSFRYDPHAPPVLQHVSFTIEPGEKVALVGPTGSGKSTLAMLLLGLYTPSEGEVLYDNRPLDAFDVRAVRRQFGVVLQEPFLFSGTIRDNLTLSNPEVGLDTIMAAARAAAVHDDIQAMPLGYDTRVSEGASSLSGGQRQRIALARAILHDPAILLLDEATSHLDVETEQEVDRNLTAMTCTRVVIAHRLSTVRNADRILVLDAGRIVEQGTHEVLVRAGGTYARLVAAQMENGETEPFAVA